VSHNSYSQAVAARSMRLPLMTAMDYEFQPANHLAFRCADVVAVPHAYPLDALRVRARDPSAHGAIRGSRRRSRLRASRLIQAISAMSASTHPSGRHSAASCGHGAVPPLQESAVQSPASAAGRRREPHGASVAEDAHAGRRDRAAGFGGLLWRGEVLDGPNAIAGADAVISAGGSMNREAAVLGTPAYSVYAGRLAVLIAPLSPTAACGCCARRPRSITCRSSRRNRLPGRWSIMASSESSWTGSQGEGRFVNTRLLRVVLVVGARPNFVKVAPIVRAMEAWNTAHTGTLRFCPVIVHTGQHYDPAMSRLICDDVGLPEPDYFLGVGSGSHAQQTAAVMVEFERCSVRCSRIWLWSPETSIRHWRQLLSAQRNACGGARGGRLAQRRPGDA